MNNEVTVSSAYPISGYLKYLHKLLYDGQQAKITAINTAIPAAVKLAEIIKRKKSGLHQQNTLEQLPNSTKVKVSILLSLTPLDPSHTGYQPPIEESKNEGKSDLVVKKSGDKIETDQNSLKNLEVSNSNPQKVEEKKNVGVRGKGRPSRGVRGSFRGRGRRNNFFDYEKSKENSMKSSPQAPGMDKYRRLFEKENVSKEKNEVFVSASRRFGNYAREVFKILEENENSEVKLKAFGTAMTKAVKIAEWVKKTGKGLVYETHYDKKNLKERYVPIEEGLDEVVKEKTLNTVEITLKKEKVN